MALAAAKLFVTEGGKASRWRHAAWTHMAVRLVTPETGAQPGELSPADRSGPRELLRYRSAQGRWVVAAMILGSSVAGIDSTVVAVALPPIGRDLHLGFQGLQWTVTSYTLTLAALILPAGSLSDQWGRRRVFLAGLSWFTVASVLCAAAPRHRMARSRAGCAGYRRCA